MQATKFKKAIQVLASFGVAIWIFWFLYRDIALQTLIDQLRASNWFWIMGSLGISIFAFWLRGWRWSLLIQSDDGQSITSGRAYHAVMIGYLVNLLIPRAGEVARCGVLTRTNGISLGHLFGTVILERTIDLLFLVTTIGLAFTIENQLFTNLVRLLIDLDSLGAKILSNLPIFIGGTGVFVIFILLIFRRYRDHGWIKKAQHFIREIGSGLKSVNQLSNPKGFWVSSILIWIIYFLTMYTISLGIPSTANLSAGEVLMVMVMGSIGMVAPVQGGIGTFHALVAFILIQLGISEENGKIFAAIIHGTQVLLILALGLISWILMLKIPNWQKPSSL
jgi:uncharacterized protein (TIRG00374 family)